MEWAWKHFRNVPICSFSVAFCSILAAVFLTSERSNDPIQRTVESTGDIGSLVQLNTLVVRGNTHLGDSSELVELSAGDKQACAKLKNQGSAFTVEVEVGTPGQKFDVIADTGSNDFWVTSCACKSVGKCFDEGRCFTGTNKSSTFLLENSDNGKGPLTVRVTYGSGPVDLVIATDMVNVGGAKAMMNDSLFLAVDHALKIPGKMEGILGLGIPQNATKLKNPPHSPGSSSGNPHSGEPWSPNSGQPWGHEPSGGDRRAGIPRSVSLPLPPDIVRQILDIMRAILGMPPVGGSHAGIYPPSLAEDTATGDAKVLLDAKRSFGVAEKGGHTKITGDEDELEISPKSFFELAKIDTFQLCFNDMDKDGAMRLGTPMGPTPLESIGQFHWGLDLQGISVGGGEALPFCTSPEAGQDTACGAIPDSGTTLITVPREDQYVELLTSICSNWDRCKSAVAKVNMKKAKLAGLNQTYIKAAMVLKLMKTCEEWLTNDTGLKEMPSIHFHLAGKNKVNQTLELTPWAYVMETTLLHKNSIDDGYFFPLQSESFHEVLLELPEDDMPRNKICSLAFGKAEFETQKNGPVWILGTSFFYQFAVGFNIKEKTVSFTPVTADKPCATCDASLTQQDTPASQQDVRPVGQRMRSLSVPPRKSSIDTNLPL